MQRVKGKELASGWVIACANGYREWRRTRRLARARASELRAAYGCPASVRRPTAQEVHEGIVAGPHWGSG